MSLSFNLFIKLYMYLSFRLSINSSIPTYLFINLYIVYIYLKLSMYLSNRLFINSSICISLNTNIFLSIDLSIHYLRLRKWSSSLSESSDLSPKASTHFLTSSRSLAAWPEISFDVFMMFSTSVLTLKLRAHCYN